LNEIHCGLLDGWLISRVEREFPELWKRNNAQNDEALRWPGGESYRGFRNRVRRIANAISRRHESQEVLVFTHAGVINQILGIIVGQSAAHWENWRPHNASITKVRWWGGGGAVESFDDRAHLAITANA
jgi:broad specificity phosphatase PhoE